MMSATLRWTSRDLEALPDDGKRYEIVDGELYMSRQPHWFHQAVCFRIAELLQAWSRQTGAGRANLAPDVIFTDDEDIAPDVVWLSSGRLAAALRPDGKLHAAPELVIEVLSPGGLNERRDREAKLKLYSRRGVSEYWIVDWRARTLEVYRRGAAALELTATLYEPDALHTPLLPDFNCPLATLFEDIPRAAV